MKNDKVNLSEYITVFLCVNDRDVTICQPLEVCVWFYKEEKALYRNIPFLCGSW